MAEWFWQLLEVTTLPAVNRTIELFKTEVSHDTYIMFNEALGVLHDNYT
jgi:hypothetical protein